MSLRKRISWFLHRMGSWFDPVVVTGSLRVPGKRWDIGRKDFAIRCCNSKVWVDVEGEGSVPCDPFSECLALTCQLPWGVGVFSYTPRAKFIADALNNNTRFVSGVIRGEEEKAFQHVERMDGVLGKYLANRRLTDADYGFLLSTHGYRREEVNDWSACRSGVLV